MRDNLSRTQGTTCPDNGRDRQPLPFRGCPCPLSLRLTDLSRRLRDPEQYIDACDDAADVLDAVARLVGGDMTNEPETTEPRCPMCGEPRWCCPCPVLPGDSGAARQGDTPSKTLGDNALPTCPAGDFPPYGLGKSEQERAR